MTERIVVDGHHKFAQWALVAAVSNAGEEVLKAVVAAHPKDEEGHEVELRVNGVPVPFTPFMNRLESLIDSEAKHAGRTLVEDELKKVEEAAYEVYEVLGKLRNDVLAKLSEKLGLHYSSES